MQWVQNWDIASTSPTVDLGTSPRPREASELLIHKTIMIKDVKGVCYHYFIGNMAPLLNSLFMCPTCLHQCVLMS